MNTWVYCVALVGAWCGGYGFGKRRGIRKASRRTENWWPFADKGVGR